MRKQITAILAAHGMTNMFKVKTVSFQDLARGEAKFVYVDGRFPDAATFDTIKAQLKPMGLILSSN